LRTTRVTELDVLLVGPYPPPYGGVSAHVERLAQALWARGVNVRVMNHFGGQRRDPLLAGDLRRNPLRYWRALRTVDARVVHYHHSRWSTLIATAFALRHCPGSTVATVHGRSLEPYLRSRVPGIAQLTRLALRGFDGLIAVSVEIERSLRDVGPPVDVIAAYIPADDHQAALSPETEAFLRGGTNLVVSAYRLTLDDHGQTIYGLETAIESFAEIAVDRPELRLCIFLASPPRSRRESDRLGSLLETVDDGDVRSRIRVVSGEPLTPALAFAAVYLRPTLTDGDAVSVREAIAAQAPVLASDVAVRPAGVRTLGPEVSEWSEAILDTLAQGQPVSGLVAAGDPVDELMSIYGRLGQPVGDATVPVPA
jgi:glycosyltransferase involved in cell wall biosynthesis